VARMTRGLWRDASPGPLLSSFSIDALAGARAVAPELPRGYLVNAIPEDWRDTLKRLACVSLHCNWKSLSGPLAGELHDAGYGILLFTVNEPATAQRMFALGADCLVTDALERIGPEFR